MSASQAIWPGLAGDCTLKHWFSDVAAHGKPWEALKKQEQKLDNPVPHPLLSEILI